MDALNELRDIEQLQNTRNKFKEAIQAIDETKELEMKLATTLFDIDMLKNEFKFVNKIGKRLLQRGEPRKEEIEAAKKDLASITKQVFKFMASMDVTRNQLKHVSAATIHLKNKESKIGAKVRNLSYKLLRAKSKLEAVSAAKEKTKSIVSNLTQTLDKLKSKTKAAKKEKDLIINGEVAETKEEIKKALLEIKVSEERFQGENKVSKKLHFFTLLELQAVKSSEALALEKLKILRENAMKDIIINVTKPSLLIIISKFQYDYLRNHAGKANEIAEKVEKKSQGPQVAWGLDVSTMREGKDNTKGFLQQTREKVKGATQGATETVKKTLGLGQHDEDNRKNY
ncbi:Protein PLASTID MOVEMENT IMPAIRED 2 [Glycine max]|nr:Protein PLASTID MOVEMENT IMPAIRED 2 [Glycine max]